MRPRTFLPTDVRRDECAFLCCLPASERSFFAQVDDERFDYARSVAGRCGGAAVAWRMVYEPFVDFLDRCLRGYASLGVRVTRNATLADVARTTADGRTRVLSILAHWRMPLLETAHIRDPEGMKAMLCAAPGPHPIQQAMHEAWSARDRTRDCRGQEDAAVALAERIVQTLRPHVVEASKAYLPNQQATPVWPELTRIGMERVVETAILERARCLEFSNGLESVDALVGAIDWRFTGMIDLSACHSAFAIDMIKSARPRNMVRGNRFPADPHLCLLRYAAMIEAAPPGRS